MNKKQTVSFAQWILRQHHNLDMLYNDFQGESKDNQKSFMDFCLLMFEETKFFQQPVASYPANLIELRVVCSGGIVQNIFSNVSGRVFDVDVIDVDIQDEVLAERAGKDVIRLEETMNKIF